MMTAVKAVALYPLIISLSNAAVLNRASVDPVWENAVAFWQLYRDEQTGLYCDEIYFNSNSSCGIENNRYNISASPTSLIQV